VEQNPVLKKAGVVDAGGMGFLVILQGMLDEIRGISAPENEETAFETKEKANFSDFSRGYHLQLLHRIYLLPEREKNRYRGSARLFECTGRQSGGRGRRRDHQSPRPYRSSGRVLEEAINYGTLITV
jgi:hypothetical protein